MSLRLQARQLACERDDRWLFDGLDVMLESGEILRVEGPNGSGKTTLLKILSGQLDDYDGALEFNGQPLRACRDTFLANLLYLGHAPGVKAGLTPLENLAWYQALGGEAPDEAACERALNDAGLAGFEDTPAGRLSAGQNRRVALARLTLTPRALWVLDEPFTALDREGVAMLERRLSHHAKAGGSVIITTHHALGGLQRVRRLRLGEALA
ncbi:MULTISPECIES: cytochrome c biogenesis heme-transporting ATPase CcmA [unclassified Halomonas]|uniref:cytochrome c biogenesis heme-transporting ATPase CcmA n=1 Tax=unclassified Halomonas TaxID=2609666 RepID=UPI0020768152|nr:MULTISPECIES: cytochrome c biogenesis heme-transporting ATPase CcmA [unclassified Halomonas]